MGTLHQPHIQCTVQLQAGSGSNIERLWLGLQGKDNLMGLNVGISGRNGKLVVLKGWFALRHRQREIGSQDGS